MAHIIAIGGGGLSKMDHYVLERYILEQTGKDRPRVCYLPQASAESESAILNFFQAMIELDAHPSWVSLFGRVEVGWQDHLLSQDVIYVGGGNTRSMLALWREWGIDAVLKQALDRGIILAGVSAGAICWFEQCVTDSVWPLGSLQGLGFVAGSCCPHYDGEPERRPSYLRMIERGAVKDGYALQDGTAAHIVDGALQQVITSQPQARAFYVYRDGTMAIEKELDYQYLAF